MSEHRPKVVLGLGNFGHQYENTRHNIGFIMLDHLAEEYGTTWQEKTKFKAHIAEVRLGAQRVILAKPTTFYNLSGEAAIALVQFYKLEPQDILVVHDELALPFGTIRTRLSGSDAGNNGVKSINAHIGQEYARVRVGVANDQLRPSNATDFVLAKFTPDEQLALPLIAKHAAKFAEDFIHEDKEFAHTSVRL